MADLPVKGLKELHAVLQGFPVKVERNALRGMLRASARPVLVEARSNAAVLTGEMRDGLKVSTRAQGSRVTASIKATGPHAYLAHLIEYGVKPHTIQGKDGKPLFIGNKFVQAVHHPGISPRPFMRPALDTKASAAVLAGARYLKTRLSTKHGINTSSIEIGDES